MFRDRGDAGEKLAQKLATYKDKKVLVLAIPRGGVEVGYHVAKFLNADFSIVISRKLPFPDDPEAGFGAVAEDGSTFIFNGATRWVEKEAIDKIVVKQRREIERRIVALRRGQPLPEMEDKIVILVDDGIAMGSTMRVSIDFCKNKKAKKIVVAVPVTGKQTAAAIEALVDEIVVLEIPKHFYAVAQVYRNWYDVSDNEVIRIMAKWQKANLMGR